MRYSTPLTWNFYPNLPSIRYQAADGGGFNVQDLRSGATFFATTMAGVHAFAADHSNGLGSVVHRATKALGISRCEPCAKRQAAMNGWFRR